MKITLGSNIASLRGQRQLGKATSGISAVYERLSSGQRINKASDDPAGLAIADALRSDARVYTQAIRNVNDSLSMYSIINAALTELSEITQRQLELAEQAANGTYSLSQRKVLDAEANALVDEYNRIVESVEFNGTKLLENPSAMHSTQLGTDSIQFTVGNELSRAVGTGQFSLQATYSVANNPRNIEIGDFNEDGIADFVVSSSGNSSAEVFLGNGDGSFNQVASLDAGSEVREVEIADFNNDGNEDLLFVAANSGFTRLYLGNGNGTFGSQVTNLVSGIGTASSVAADLNNDGNIDLIVADDDDPGVSVYYGNGDGRFTDGTLYATGDELTNVGLGDFNNDGIDDLVVTHTAGNAYVSVLLGEGDGTFSNAITTNSVPLAHLTLGDFNHDGFLDVFTGGIGAARGILLTGDGTGTFSQPYTFLSAGNVREPTAGDLNNDGKLDIVLIENNQVTIGIGDGNGNFSTSVSYSDITTGLASQVVDANGDDVLDLLVSDTATEEVLLYLGITERSSKMQQLTLLTQSSAQESLEIVREQLTRISSEQGAIGAIQQRLSYAANHLYSTRDTYIEAENRIRAVDIAAEGAELVRLRIMQQAATAVLGQANLLPSLSLLLIDS